MSTHNIGFTEDLTIIIFQLSSNTHLISSSVSCRPNEPCHVETCLWGFRPGSTQNEVYNHRRWLEALNFGFRK